MLQLSDSNDDSDDSEDSADVEIEETQPSPPTPLTCPPKPKLDLRATDADLNTGLFKFFPKVSRDEHLMLAWKPSAQELRDQEQGRHWKKCDIFEKTVRKRERAAERKRQQRAREKAAKQVSSFSSYASCLTWSVVRARL